MSKQITDAPVTQMVFRYPWKTRTIIFSVCFVTVLTLRLMYQTLVLPDLAYWILGFLFCDLVGQCHRKIEISEQEVGYRPMFWSLRKAKFADITSIEKGKVGQGWPSSGGGLVPGMRLERPDRNPMPIPLNLPKGEEIFERIAKAWERQRSTPAATP